MCVCVCVCVYVCERCLCVHTCLFGESCIFIGVVYSIQHETPVTQIVQIPRTYMFTHANTSVPFLTFLLPIARTLSSCASLPPLCRHKVADANAAKAQDGERERRVLAEIEHIKALQAAEGDKKDGKTPSASEFSSAEFADEHRRSQGRMAAQ